MPKRKLTTTFTYRHRFVLAYVTLAAAVIALVTRAFLLASGTTSAERKSVAEALTVTGVGVDAPYHFLQNLSLHLFGLSPLGIKAPSLLIGVLTVVGFLLLMGRWTRKSTSIVATLTFVAGVTFLILTVTGSPAILYVFYPIALLLLGTYLIEKRRTRFIALVLLVGLISIALLTPGMIYMILAGVGISLLSPHIRHGIRRLGVGGVGGLVIGTIAALLPVILATYGDLSRLWTVLLIPAQFNLDILVAHAKTLADLFFGFLAPGFLGALPRPIIGLSGFGLSVIGLVITARSLYTARSRFLVTWFVLSVILAFIQPALAVLVFTVFALFVGLALDWIARYWYGMFPFNPYARQFGLALIIFMVLGAVGSNILRYESTISYARTSQSLYSQDLNLILRTNTQEQAAPMTLLVGQQDTAFYTGIMLTRPNIYVTSDVQAARPNSYILASTPLDQRTPSRIITDSRGDDADRFYVYR